MLRAVRFAATLGLKITPLTELAMSRHAPEIDTVSAERVREELVKTLSAVKTLSTPSRLSTAIEILNRTRLLARILPELSATQGVTQEGPHHDRDVYGHTLAVLDSIPPEADVVLKLAAIFHDTGKVATKTVKKVNGELKASFYGHEAVSEKLARAAMTRLRFDNTSIEAVAHLVKNHMRPNNLYNGPYSERAVRRVVRTVNPAGSKGSVGRAHLPGALEIMALNRADILGHADPRKDGHKRELEAHARLLEQVEEISGTPWEKRPENATSPLNGYEILDLFGERFGNNGRPGPWIGSLKANLEQMVAENTLAPDDAQHAIEAAEKFLQKLNKQR